MGFEPLLTAAVIAAVFMALVFTRVGPDMVLMGGLVVLLVAGVIEPGRAFSGFSNTGVITVGLLFVVAAGMRETGVVGMIGGVLLGRARRLTAIQGRLMPGVAFLSAFLNNTPLVAMMLPALTDWGRRHRIPASKLLIPLSYAAILGGICTLVGTSTNLVVYGMMIDSGMEPMGIFEISKVGVPLAIMGIGFVLIAGRWLLPDRSGQKAELADPREYVLEMIVEQGSPLVGKSIEAAGLRHLEGLYLAEIDRRGKAIPAVGPQEQLEAGDRLIFVGIVESVVDLRKIRGLVPATDQVFKLKGAERDRTLIEAVVSHTSPHIGQTIRESRFRTQYNAVVIAVSRNGERVAGKIGDIEVRAGDTLLLEAPPAFLEIHRNSRDFYLVSRVEGYTAPRHDKAWLALIILAAMVLMPALGVLPMLMSAALACGALLVTRCLTGQEARDSVDWRVLIAIGGAFGIGLSMESSGLAASVAQTLIGFAGTNPLLVLAAVYLITVLMTEMVTNNAAAVLIFPIALAAAGALGVSPMPFMFAIMIAASCSFSTPIGYQTNLMIYGPGGYRFTDFMRIGLPLTLVLLAGSLFLIPRIWPFG